MKNNEVLKGARNLINEKMKKYNFPRKCLNICFDSLRGEYSADFYPDMAVLYENGTKYDILLVDTHHECKKCAEALKLEGINTEIRTINQDGIKYFKNPDTKPAY